MSNACLCFSTLQLSSHLCSFSLKSRPFWRHTLCHSDATTTTTTLFAQHLLGIQRSWLWRLILKLLWVYLHLFVKLVHLVIVLIDKLRCYLILIRHMFNHKPLGLNKIQSVAIVVDSDEAFQILKVLTVVRWLSTFGVKRISLYDMDGVLKESKKFLVKNWSDLSVREWKEVDKKVASPDQKSLELEWLTYSDGKEGIVRAARYIYSNHSKPLLADAHDTKQTVGEIDVDKALQATGTDGPEPDLLLIYGPVRCHLGFPAWRMRYTEIIHMGKLRSISFSGLLKVLHDFSNKHQNYGK